MDSERAFSSINAAAFDRILSKYPSTVPKKMGTLEQRRWVDIPNAVQERRPRYATKDELDTLMDWKLAHGKFRPNLKKLIQQNEGSTVEEVTTAHINVHTASKTDEIIAAVKGLCVLRGVGPATASLLLSTANSDLPFFSDELYRWAMFDEVMVSGKAEKVGWQREIKYTIPEYRELLLRVAGFRDRFSKESGRNVQAIDVEKVAYVLAKSAEGDLRKQAVEASTKSSSLASKALHRHSSLDEKAQSQPSKKRSQKAIDAEPSEHTSGLPSKRSRAR
ncbi:hypothetical protein BAUCODRAFT_33291 [Baudoinia panamericana UAMH 10762]|uniref:Uncharacterized protein n=1 Tax=Baudoinia panamericana (strain UAMH 10762) TaxID=717646 RepID=M2LSV4_BAUPA|nr:uncharacterized protein BAUCODRAFT_33291 [Baudoinia panamericana UAMH 10762]EMC97577.1 hypothetical protein BAUCODRAFT_33291 [Baudoinia panamericana UAMH 10762]